MKEKEKPLPNGYVIIKNLNLDKLKSIIRLTEGLRGKYNSRLHHNHETMTKIGKKNTKNKVEVLDDLMELLNEIKTANEIANNVDFTDKIEMG